MEQNYNREREIDLVKLLLALWKKAIRIIVIGIITAILIAGFKFITSSSAQPNNYVGTTKIFVAETVPGSTAEAIRNYITSSDMLDRVNKDMGLISSVDQLKSMVSLDGSTDTLLTIKASGNDENLVQKATESIATIATRQIRVKFDYFTANILEPAYVKDLSNANTSSYRNQIVKFGVIGFILGAFLATFVYIVLFMYDSTLKDEKDVYDYLKVPVLGTIPAIKGTRRFVDKGKKHRKRRLSQYVSE